MARLAVTQWSLWRQPRVVVVVVLTVEIAAAIAPFLLTASVTQSDLGVATLLASLSIAYSLLTRRWERARFALRGGIHPTVCPNLLSAWGMAAAILLPLSLAAAVLVVAAIAEWPARNITGQAKPYRFVYTAASTILSAVTARLCLELGLPRQLGLLTSAVAYTFTCVAVIALAVASSGQFRTLSVYLWPSSYRLDFLSALIALSQVELQYLRFPLLWLSLPVTMGIQRRTVRADLHSAVAETTIKPMLEESWLIAATEIVDALPVVSIMRVNTAEPLAAAAVAQLQAGCDAIGYAGQSGLAMLLVDCPGVNADALAARLRTALQYKGLVASVAVAAKQRDGDSLDDLLAICEAELITRDAANRSAKRSRPDA